MHQISATSVYIVEFQSNLGSEIKTHLIMLFGNVVLVIAGAVGLVSAGVHFKPGVQFFEHEGYQGSNIIITPEDGVCTSVADLPYAYRQGSMKVRR